MKASTLGVSSVTSLLALIRPSHKRRFQMMTNHQTIRPIRFYRYAFVAIASALPIAAVGCGGEGQMGDEGATRESSEALYPNEGCSTSWVASAMPRGNCHDICHFCSGYVGYCFRSSQGWWACL